MAWTLTGTVSALPTLPSARRSTTRATVSPHWAVAAEAASAEAAGVAVPSRSGTSRSRAPEASATT